MHADAAGTFTVTKSRLHELAGEVASLGARLDATRGLAADLSDAFGSDAVAAGFAHFVTGWRDGRRQIVQEVNALSRMLDQAAQVYDETDASLAAAIPAGLS